MKESKPRSMTDQERKSLENFYQQVESSLAEIDREVQTLQLMRLHTKLKEENALLQDKLESQRCELKRIEASYREHDAEMEELLKGSNLKKK